MRKQLASPCLIEASSEIPWKSVTQSSFQSAVPECIIIVMFRLYWICYKLYLQLIKDAEQFNYPHHRNAPMMSSKWGFQKLCFKDKTPSQSKSIVFAPCQKQNMNPERAVVWRSFSFLFFSFFWSTFFFFFFAVSLSFFLRVFLVSKSIDYKNE